jgi:thioredoxin reductase
MAASRNVDDARTDLAVRALFVFIGPRPQPSLLTGVVPLDPYGFVLTGTDVDGRSDQITPLEQRSILQTSQSRIFAAGVVRRGATRRVAAAMGEGPVAVALVNQYLARRARCAPCLSGRRRHAASKASCGSEVITRALAIAYTVAISTTKCPSNQ